MRKSIIALCLGWVGSLWVGSAWALEVEEPEPGRRASTVLALVLYNYDLCDGLAQRTVAAWQRAGGVAESRAEVRKVLDSEATAVAQGREASDLVEPLLEEVSAEVGAETASSLVRLVQKARGLCDVVVAFKETSLEDFEVQLLEVREEFNREEKELGRLLVVPEDELEEALQPYLKSIQLAGFEAENEYLDFQDSQRKPPKQRTHQQRMEEWHARYRAVVQPTREALGKYIGARQENDFRTMSKACREILTLVAPLLRNEEVFKVPMPMVPASKGWQNSLLPPLRDSYKAMRDMAVDCSAGRSREMQEHLGEMQKGLGSAATFLARFSLRP
jgi:nitrate reductase NapAB chaperone NapD